MLIVITPLRDYTYSYDVYITRATVSILVYDNYTSLDNSNDMIVKSFVCLHLPCINTEQKLGELYVYYLYMNNTSGMPLLDRDLAWKLRRVELSLYLN